MSAFSKTTHLIEERKIQMLPVETSEWCERGNILWCFLPVPDQSGARVRAERLPRLCDFVITAENIEG